MHTWDRVARAFCLWLSWLTFVAVAVVGVVLVLFVIVGVGALAMLMLSALGITLSVDAWAILGTIAIVVAVLFMFAYEAVNEP